MISAVGREIWGSEHLGSLRSTVAGGLVISAVGREIWGSEHLGSLSSTQTDGSVDLRHGLRDLEEHLGSL